MIPIMDVIVISIDKCEDSWAIEGEIVFEADFTTAFSVTYLTMYDDLEDLEIEIDPGEYDAKQLKEMIIAAAMEYDE